MTIAGSDSSSGAGIQADLKTFAAHEVYGCSVLTAITAQNTLNVYAARSMGAKLVAAQIDAVLEDFPVAAAKTGMLPNASVVRSVTARLNQLPDLPLVVDPVVVATSGARLIDEGALRAIQKHLIPAATLLTPNLEEAAILSGHSIANESQLQNAAEQLLATGCQAVLIKGGHAPGQRIVDILQTADGLERFEHPRQSGQYHGTGCTLSASITANLCLGMTLTDAVAGAIDYVQRAICASHSPLKGSSRILAHNV